jgi:hypothetical protein
LPSGVLSVIILLLFVWFLLGIESRAWSILSTYFSTELYPQLKFTAYFKLFFFFLWYWGLNSGLHAYYTGAVLLELHLWSIFSGYFGDWVSQTVCLGWPLTMILPFSASQVVRITGVSHQCTASVCLSFSLSLCLSGRGVCC